MKILIVDDSTFMRTILKNIILTSKYSHAEIIESPDGEDALKKYHELSPDIMLLDIVMPGKDGLAVLKELGTDVKSIAVISSVDQPDVVDQAVALGAKGYVVKPFDDSEVLSMLDTLAG
jgi:two-component system chemotaxis response regulator CheY